MIDRGGIVVEPKKGPSGKVSSRTACNSYMFRGRLPLINRFPTTTLQRRASFLLSYSTGTRPYRVHEGLGGYY